MSATLDGVVGETGAVNEAKFMLPWAFSEEAASIITGGGKWAEIWIAADPLYQHLLLTAEKKFWRCSRFSDRPHLFGVVPPKPRIEGVRVVDIGAAAMGSGVVGTPMAVRSAPR
jgi:hypothetical protein